MKPSNPKEPLSNLYTQNLDTNFIRALHLALDDVTELETSVGTSVADIEHKKQVKAKMDRALLPFRIAAAAWSGGIMLGPEKCDDDAYSELLLTIAKTGDLPERIESENLQKMITCGLGCEDITGDRDTLYSLGASRQCVPALSYDLTFPEVFYPTGVPHGRQGFHTVLGNPPWDAIKFNSKEFFASFDFEILNASTKREREALEKRLTTDAFCGPLFELYKEDFEAKKRANDCFYIFQKVRVEGDLAGRQVDEFRVFMERNNQLLRTQGLTGVVVPSAFHANEGATGVRKLYLEEMKLRCCYSFENRRKLFEIHSSFKFALIVAKAGQATTKFPCIFYLHDDEWLFGDLSGRKPLTYSVDFIKKTSGNYLTLLEIRDGLLMEIANQVFSQSVSFEEFTSKRSMRFQTSPVSLHMSHEAHRFRDLTAFCSSYGDPRKPEHRASLLRQGAFYLSEGKTFHQFDEAWGDPPRYLVPIGQLDSNPIWIEEARYYRLAFRAIASSTNERTSIFCLFSPGTVCGNSVALERNPSTSSRVNALYLAALCNSFTFDFALRIMTSANVNLFIMNHTPILVLDLARPYLIHSALRLSCNHSGYEQLWRDQVCDLWRESDKEPFTWPVLDGDDKRWEVRSAIDAVVADAYLLSREQYEHVLSTFSHASYPKAPELCLAKFDELKKIGVEAFTKKYDPYWDIPLNENLPKPVIDLPIPRDDDQEEGKFKLTGELPPKRKKRNP